MLMEQLTMERSVVTAIQKSARGIVGGTLAAALAAEGPNKSRRVIVGGPSNERPFTLSSDRRIKEIPAWLESVL